MAQFASAGQAFYAAAGALADESITLIKTVMAFGTQEKEIARCVCVTMYACECVRVCVCVCEWGRGRCKSLELMTVEG
jgi:hypothetical protein